MSRKKIARKEAAKGKNIDWRIYCIALEKDSVLAKIL